jgi:starch synthase
MLERRRFQLVVLGTGEARYEEFFRRLGPAFPRQAAYLPAFSEKLAHAIEAGADMFLMPSRYEPCGLNQMYSLRYGTAPIVHRTGGLADTVWNFDPATGRGTGFVFDHFDDAGLAWALGRALDVWGHGAGDARTAWRRLQRNGMGLPLGWSHRVGEYTGAVSPHRARRRVAHHQVHRRGGRGERVDGHQHVAAPALKLGLMRL